MPIRWFQCGTAAVICSGICSDPVLYCRNEARLNKQDLNVDDSHIVMLKSVGDKGDFTTYQSSTPMVDLTSCEFLLVFSLHTHTHTHTETQPFYGSMDFVRDNPDEPVPEETFTHSLVSWLSVVPYLLHPSTTIHGILPVQSTCLTIFFHNLSQVFFGLPLGLAPSTSYSIHFFTQLLSSFCNTCSYPYW